MQKDNSYIDKLVSRMTLDQKVGALMTLGFSGTVVRPHLHEYIQKYYCGGLRLSPRSRTFGSYLDPKTGKMVINVEDNKGYKKGINPPAVTAPEYREILDGLQKLAMDRPLAIPLHFSFDQEGGSGADFFFGGVNIFPKPMGIRATGDSKLAYEVALAVSRQCRATGFNWIHSPVLDVNVNPDNPGIGVRSYSDRLEDVIEYAEQACLGFKKGGLIATGKHFPGRGDSSVDPHYGVLTIDIDKDGLYSRDLLPYKNLIQKKLLPSIMIAHAVYPKIDEDVPATVSRKIITGMCREYLGFEGVITTDSMTMGAISTRYKVEEACAMALQAGADLVLMKAENELVPATFNAIKRYVEERKISEEDLNDKVYRVLSCKHEYGLFNYGSQWKENPENVLKDKEIIRLSSLVARKSVLIARDRKNLLPLSEEAKLLVIEQMNASINNINWHPGKFFKNCLKYNKNADYLEVDFTPDEFDKNNIRELAKSYDIIVVTNFYSREAKGNNEVVGELIADKTKNIVVISNTPYKNTIPDDADTVVLTFATSPANMEITAGVIFGQIAPEGEWPLKYRIPD
jgi:beta-N-acetylhexosaminidase